MACKDGKRHADVVGAAWQKCTEGFWKSGSAPGLPWEKLGDPIRGAGTVLQGLCSSLLTYLSSLRFLSLNPGPEDARHTVPGLDWSQTKPLAQCTTTTFGSEADY